MVDYFPREAWLILRSTEQVAKLQKELLPHQIDIDELIDTLDCWVETCRLLGNRYFAEAEERRRAAIRLLPPAIRASKRAALALQAVKDWEDNTNDDLGTTFCDVEVLARTTESLRALIRDFEKDELEYRKDKPVSGFCHLLPEQHFFTLIAKYWLYITGAPPRVDRQGKFSRFLYHITEILPSDCYVRQANPETLRDWLDDFRKLNTGEAPQK